jgi:two-component system, NtrC family, sensor kinase
VPLSLTHFGLAEMLRWGIDLPRIAAEAATLEEAAQGVVRHIYQDALSPAGARECALVRCFVTLPCATLPRELKAFAQAQLAGPPPPELQCLVLLGTVGDQPEWNTRQLSSSYQAIPLTSVASVRRAPMLGQLMRSLGVPLHAVVAPRAEMVRGLLPRGYDVFYVPEALSSPHIPAQDFVREHGIRSVIGFGGALGAGLYTLVIFSRAAIPEPSAERFRHLALDLQTAFAEFGPERVFAPLPAGVA